MASIMARPVISPSFSDRAFYAAHFMDVGLWEPIVRWVCTQHGLEYLRLNPCLPGSFPTFKVELHVRGDQKSASSLVVKFFGPLFDGLMSFEVERDLGSWLSQESLPIPSPHILAEGQLDKTWRYLFFEYVPGDSIGQVRDRISRKDWLLEAKRLGAYLNRLHSLRIPNSIEETGEIQPGWKSYASFLRTQRRNCVANHQAWNDLPARLLDQIETFIVPAEELIDFSAQAYLIHADLTADHLLGRLVNGAWMTQAIIDWGDARTGNLFYELVALHLDLFRSDQDLLRCFLEAYNPSSFYQREFARKAFSTVLLHEFPMPAYVYAPHQDVSSLQELAARLFGI